MVRVLRRSMYLGLRADLFGQDLHHEGGGGQLRADSPDDSVDLRPDQKGQHGGESKH